ncbi:MAG: SMC-Scp complex subunit ScpB [Candidatus Woesearchaeota archaeon]|jgi:segregation and condensation protein B
METSEKRVEAVLFAVGKEITSERIGVLCSLEVPQVEELLNKLQQEYSQRDHSLHIVKKESGWKLTVRDEFVPLVSSLVSSTELDSAMMATLAVIAWKYPVLQSEVIKLRGSGAYDHMHQLEEQGYVEKEKFGRSFKLKLTKKFFEYFDLPSEEAKQAFLKLIPDAVLKEAEAVDKQADEVGRLIDLDQKEREGKSEIQKAMQVMKKDDEKLV